MSTENLDKLDMFHGSPVEKWKEVIFNASRTLSNKELERILEELSMYEIMFEMMLEDGKGVKMDTREFRLRIKNEEDLKMRFRDRKNSLAIESTSMILSDNE